MNSVGGALASQIQQRGEGGEAEEIEDQARRRPPPKSARLRRGETAPEAAAGTWPKAVASPAEGRGRCWRPWPRPRRRPWPRPRRRPKQPVNNRHLPIADGRSAIGERARQQTYVLERTESHYGNSRSNPRVFRSDEGSWREDRRALPSKRPRSSSDYLEEVHGIKPAAGGAVMMAAPAGGGGRRGRGRKDRVRRGPGRLRRQENRRHQGCPRGHQPGSERSRRIWSRACPPRSKKDSRRKTPRSSRSNWKKPAARFRSSRLRRPASRVPLRVRLGRRTCLMRMLPPMECLRRARCRTATFLCCQPTTVSRPLAVLSCTPPGIFRAILLTFFSR